MVSGGSKAQALSILRRPPSASVPERTSCDDKGIIHPQCINGGSTGRRLPDNGDAIQAPREMLTPGLGPRVVERCFGLRHGIRRVSQRAFVGVAAAAAQPQVL